MKTMKTMKTILVAMTLMLGFTSFGQTITFNELNSATERVKGKFTEYHAKDGAIYKVGETLTIGSPSGTNFVHVQSMDIGGTVRYLTATVAHKSLEIKKIRVGGNKRSGFTAVIITRSVSGVENYYFEIEAATMAGEVQSSTTIMTSSEALAKLKEAKDKLDLGLITQAEFDTLRDELAPLIK